LTNDAHTGSCGHTGVAEQPRRCPRHTKCPSSATASTIAAPAALVGGKAGHSTALLAARRRVRDRCLWRTLAKEYSSFLATCAPPPPGGGEMVWQGSGIAPLLRLEDSHWRAVKLNFACSCRREERLRQAEGQQAQRWRVARRHMGAMRMRMEGCIAREPKGRCKPALWATWLHLCEAEASGGC